MAENLTVARPYAKAAFDLALSANSTDTWQNMLCAMACACKDEVFLQALKNSASPESAVALMKQLLEGLLNEEGESFLNIIGENQRFEVLPEIHEEFVRLKNEHDRVLKATVTSARALEAAELKALSDKLSSKYACEVTLENVIDPSIMGGAILKVGDEVIDASVKTSLKSLSSTLK